jgi:bacterioferritin B
MPSLLKQSIVDALNRQVIEEFTASNQYIAMALYFDSETLPQLSKYFHLQANEEHMHGMKLLQYITDAGGQPVVPATREPKNQFSSVEEAVELALNQELTVTQQINELVSVAAKENDYLTREILQWFVTEQLEEVSTMTDLLNVVRRANKNLFRVEDFLAQNPHEAETTAAD